MWFKPSKAPYFLQVKIQLLKIQHSVFTTWHPPTFSASSPTHSLPCLPHLITLVTPVLANAVPQLKRATHNYPNTLPAFPPPNFCSYNPLCLRYPLPPFSTYMNHTYHAKWNSDITLLKLKLFCPHCHELHCVSSSVLVHIIVWILLCLIACVCGPSRMGTPWDQPGILLHLYALVSCMVTHLQLVEFKWIAAHKTLHDPASAHLSRCIPNTFFHALSPASNLSA